MNLITLEQYICNILYHIFKDKPFVINLQVRINTKKHEKNIIHADEIIMTDENGNYIQ